MSGEDREFRIYASSKGEEPVATAHSVKELALQLSFERKRLPEDVLTVREVFERVVSAYNPDGTIVGFDPPPTPPTV